MKGIKPVKGSKGSSILTLNVGRQPTGLARLAWNVLKLINMYAARKKFEMSGAIELRSPTSIKLQESSIHLHMHYTLLCVLRQMNNLQHGYEESQHIATHWLIVLAVALGKPNDFRVELILAQSLSTVAECQRYQSASEFGIWLT